MYATLGIEYARLRHEHDVCCAERKAFHRAALREAAPAATPAGPTDRGRCVAIGQPGHAVQRLEPACC
jgi:hypothetical protein